MAEADAQSAPTEAALDQLCEIIRENPRLVVLTGAGISTASGIPAYRDELGRWLGSDPIQHGDFIADPTMRQRYWARSAFGWRPVAEAAPNPAHIALAALEKAGWIDLLITQNVDRLHQKAGHQRVVDLHGRLDRVKCLGCGGFETRADFQIRLLAKNPALEALIGNDKPALAPDGDAWVAGDLVAGILTPVCEKCGGVMMPDVVFFGGTVPAERVERSRAAVESADALLVVGSSLMVYSGFRFCRLAHAAGKPVVAINQGATRADDLLSMKLEAECGTALLSVETRLGVMSC